VTRVLHRPTPGEEHLTAPAALSSRYPAPDLALPSHVRAVLEPPRLGCVPGTSRAVIDELRAADAPVRDDRRYDPNRLLPRTARVRQVRVETLRLRSMGQVDALLARIEQLVEVA
jgi:hypothetical protein